MLKIHRNVPSLMYSTTFLKDICDIEVKVNMCMKEHGCYTYMCHYDLVVCERGGGGKGEGEIETRTGLRLRSIYLISRYLRSNISCIQRVDFPDHSKEFSVDFYKSWIDKKMDTRHRFLV